MKARSRLFAAVTLLGLCLPLAGCPDDSPYVPQDDAAVDATTFTSFVIDLINNQTNDSAPVSYDTFKDLPDPDGADNNTAAYESLFQ